MPSTHTHTHKHTHIRTQVMSSRELSLVSRHVLNNGKALVIAANKMDALEGEEEQQLYLKTLRACMVCMLLLLIGHCLYAFL